MGVPIHFQEANLVLGPPGGHEEAVVPLPVHRHSDGYLTSCWQFSAEELDELRRSGGKVWLQVWGRTSQPPVFVTAMKDQVLP